MEQQLGNDIEVRKDILKLASAINIILVSIQESQGMYLTDKIEEMSGLIMKSKMYLSQFKETN